MTAVLASWSRRRWLVALGTGAATVLVIALPTALIPTPVFGREVPPTVERSKGKVRADVAHEKLLALGYTGALQWFGPIQPYLGAFGVVLLAWALWVRLRGEVACPVPST